MATTNPITVIRHATGERRCFETKAEALRFCLRRGDANELWQIEG